MKKKLALFIFLYFALTPFYAQSDNPAYDVLRRTIGDGASKFVLIEEKSTHENDWFEINIKDNKIYVKGNNPIALCKGAYTFIKDNNLGVITWEGVNVHIPDELNNGKTYNRVTSSTPLRMYINPCTYGYTMAWWTWERWEKELDWMALHGINMPVALLGQEIIWQQVWEEMGIKKSELRDYHCGPAFLPWFRMGNLYNHCGPLPQSWMEKEKLLQQKIISRMKVLGMKPIVPAFSGHIPPYFKKKYPNSITYELKNWGGLEPEKASLLLDPKDPLFKVAGKLFLKKYEETYGKADLFLADTFNEMYPPVSKENKNVELAEYGEAIYKAIQEHNPEATWVLQGWTFGHQSDFWTPMATKSFLSRIPKNNLMMLNYGEDRHSIWEKLEAFYGSKWTYGYVHNYGGHQSLFGDLNFYHDKYVDLINNPKKGNLVGYGCLPEAIENNSIAYEYIFDIPWGATNFSVENWVNNHIENRYEKRTPAIEKAWQIALKNTYSVKEWKTGKNIKGYGTYIHNNRPSLNITMDHYLGNPDAIPAILNILLKEYEQNKNSDLLYYDILDFAQHYTAYKADYHLVKTSDYYKTSEFKKGDVEFEKTKTLLKKLEVLQVATGGSFTKWCNDAKALATSEEEEALYIRNAKTQISIWGGNRLKDYASKSWSGILLDFYLPRWQMFFDDVKRNKTTFDEKTAQKNIRKWEEQWTLDPSIPVSPKKIQTGQYINLIKEILEHYNG